MFFKKKGEEKKKQAMKKALTRLERREALRVGLEEQVLEMTSKYCPINKQLCQVECIHFEHGRLTTRIVGYEYMDFTINPKCKLWK